MTPWPTRVDCRDWMTPSTVVLTATTIMPAASSTVPLVSLDGNVTSRMSRSRNGEAMEMRDEATMSSPTRPSWPRYCAKRLKMRRMSPACAAGAG